MIGPPDQAQRIEILRHEVIEAIKDNLSAWKDKGECDPNKIAASMLNEELRNRFAAATVLMTFGELKLVAVGVLSLLRSAKDMKELQSDEFMQRIRSRLSEDCSNAEKPSIRLVSYLNRFRNQLTTAQKPFTEFFVLLYIRLEVVDAAQIEPQEQEVIYDVFNSASGRSVHSPETVLADWIKDAALCKDIFEGLKPVLERCLKNEPRPASTTTRSDSGGSISRSAG
jgi:hypothetical protein